MATTPLEEDDKRSPVPDNGLGVLCHEAQADGVPCCEPGRLCAKCERAWFRQDEAGHGIEARPHSEAPPKTP